MKFMVYHRFLLVPLLLFCGDLFAFDHQYREYAGVLSQYVHNGRVDYSGLQKGRKGIDVFVDSLSKVTAAEYQSWNRDQQLAFWINAYNGWFLQIVIDRYPIRGGRLIGVLYPKNSVQRIPGIWDNIKTKAAGREVSLNDVEHKIIRPVFREPRIHFAIVCASVGCPALRSKPFLADGLSGQLDDAARDFINDPGKVRWNDRSMQLEVSSIFNWFKEDFASSGGVVEFVARYAREPLAGRLRTGKIKVDYLDYDWSLNEMVPGTAGGSPARNSVNSRQYLTE